MLFDTFRRFSLPSNYDIILEMPNKKSYYPTANLRKRMKRRMLKHPECTDDAYSSIEYCKDRPTHDELKEALVESKQSTRGILKLAALVDNLSAYLSPRYKLYEVDYSDRTPGIRQYLEKDPFLKSKYKTIMRYKKLAALIKAKISEWDSDVQDGYYNLLWGLEPPQPDEDWPETREALRELYASFEGMNFKEIQATVERCV